MTDHPAAIAERERIVAWLRKEARENMDSGFEDGALAYSAFMYCVDALLRRDHITQSGGRGG